jgi:hypothetical protein
MLRIKVNGTPTCLLARPRLDGRYDLRCVDPLVSEFRLCPGDVLYLWLEEAGDSLRASEADLAELAVQEAEEKGN